MKGYTAGLVPSLVSNLSRAVSVHSLGFFPQDSWHIRHLLIEGAKHKPMNSDRKVLFPSVKLSVKQFNFSVKLSVFG